MLSDDGSKSIYKAVTNALLRERNDLIESLE